MAKIERKLWERIFLLDNRIILEPENYEICYPIVIEQNNKENVFYAEGLYTEGNLEQSEKGWWGCSLTVNFSAEGNTAVNPEIMFKKFGIGFYKLSENTSSFMPMKIDGNKYSITIYGAFEKVLSDGEIKDKNYNLINRRLNNHRRIKIETVVTNNLVENKFLLDTWYSHTEPKCLIKVKEKYKICKGVKKDCVKVINQDVIDRVKINLKVVNYLADSVFDDEGSECGYALEWAEEKIEWLHEDNWAVGIRVLAKDLNNIPKKKWVALADKAVLENVNNPKEIYNYYYSTICDGIYSSDSIFPMDRSGDICIFPIIFTIKTIEATDDWDVIEAKFKDKVYSFSSGLYVQNDLAYSLLKIEGRIDFSKEQQDINDITITEIKSGLLKND